MPPITGASSGIGAASARHARVTVIEPDMTDTQFFDQRPRTLDQGAMADVDLAAGRAGRGWPPCGVEAGKKLLREVTAQSFGIELKLWATTPSGNSLGKTKIAYLQVARK